MSTQALVRKVFVICFPVSGGKLKSMVIDEDYLTHDKGYTVEAIREIRELPVDGVKVFPPGGGKIWRYR